MGAIVNTLAEDAALVAEKLLGWTPANEGWWKDSRDYLVADGLDDLLTGDGMLELIKEMDLRGYTTELEVNGGISGVVIRKREGEDYESDAFSEINPDPTEAVARAASAALEAGKENKNA